MSNTKSTLCITLIFLIIMLSIFHKISYGQGMSFNREENGSQAIYLIWSQRKFSSYLNRDIYTHLPKQTAAELEEYWLAKLKKQMEKRSQILKKDNSYTPDDYEKIEAINILATLRSKKSSEMLINIAMENIPKDNRERWMAVRAIGLIGIKEYVPQLIHLIYHWNQNTRLWAQITLVKLTGVNFGYDWQEWGKWWNSQGNSKKFDFKKIEWKLPPDGDSSWLDLQKNENEDAKFIDTISEMNFLTY